jgi:hypothetical protein
VRGLVLALLVASAPAHAKIAVLDSVEWQAQDADVVVRGVVLRVDGQGKEYVNVTVQVTEALRGGAAKSLRFAMHESEVPVLIWHRDRTDLLLFLVDSARRDPSLRFAPLALRQRRPAIELGLQRVPAADFADLERVDDILTAARTACSGPRVTTSMQVDVPFETPLFERVNGGSSVYLNVATEDIRRRGLRLLASPNASIRGNGAALFGASLAVW